MASLMRLTVGHHLHFARHHGDAKMLRNCKSLKLFVNVNRQPVKEAVRCAGTLPGTRLSSDTLVRKGLNFPWVNICSKKYNGRARMTQIGPNGPKRHKTTLPPYQEKFQFEFEKVRKTLVPKNTVIYVRPESHLWRFGGVAAVIFTAMGLTMAYNTAAVMNNPKHQKRRVLRSQTEDRLVSFCLSITVIFMIPFSLLCGALVVTYPKHVVQKLTLLKNAKGIVMHTHANFKPPQAVTISMDKISRGIAYNKRSPYASLNVQGKYFSFLMDIKKGTFYEPELFNNPMIFPETGHERTESFVKSSFRVLTEKAKSVWNRKSDSR